MYFWDFMRITVYQCLDLFTHGVSSDVQWFYVVRVSMVSEVYSSYGFPFPLFLWKWKYKRNSRHWHLAAVTPLTYKNNNFVYISAVVICFIKVASKVTFWRSFSINSRSKYNFLTSKWDVLLLILFGPWEFLNKRIFTSYMPSTLTACF